MVQDFSQPSHVPLSLSDARAAVDQTLEDFFRQRLSDAEKLHPDYQELWKTMYAVFRGGGKRLRPYITLLTYQACGQHDYERIVPAAAAQELLHIAVLIHDDIIDRADVRHGVKNVTGYYFVHYRNLLHDLTERRHFSNSAALLAGDLLISYSYLLLQSCKIDPALILKATETHGLAIFNIAGGELLDTEATFRPTGHVRPEVINYYKTSTYSFISPLTMGAELAEASDAAIEKLAAFGDELGAAFQLRDDLLDVFGDRQKTGKPVSGDIREAKYTHLIERFYEMASREQQETFSKYFGKADLSGSEFELAKQLLETTGAKAATEKAIERHAEQASAALQTLQLTDEFQAAFQMLIAQCTKRAA